jgi:hypothetical protein
MDSELDGKQTRTLTLIRDREAIPERRIKPHRRPHAR